VSIIEVGKIIDGRYQIVSSLAEGGMSAVYKAYDRRKERWLAIKLISRERLQDERHVLRFKQEAIMTARLDHPSVTKVHDYGLTEEGQPYLVMDFVEGKTLSAMIAEKGQLPLKDMLTIFIEICDCLIYAHENKILHRDLKPSNIMIAGSADHPSVKLLDFGIAKISASAGAPSLHLTRSGELVGSPFYMSPEQAKGNRIDHRSDLYSLGCTLYEALTGGPPHIGESAISTLLKRESHEALPMEEASFGRAFPAQLEGVVARLLKHDANERYQSAAELKRDLLKLIEEPDASAASNKAITARKSERAVQTFSAAKPARLAWIFATLALVPMLLGSTLLFAKSKKQEAITRPALVIAPDHAPVTVQQLNEVENSIRLNLLRAEAVKLDKEGKHSEAQASFVKAIENYGAKQDPSSSSLLELRKDLAWSYLQSKQYDKAARQYEQFLAACEKTRSPDDQELARIRFFLAQAYEIESGSSSRPLSNKAVELYERAAQCFEKHLPETDYELCICLEGEARHFVGTKNPERQSRILAKLLKLRAPYVSSQDPEMLKLRREQSQLLRNLNRFDEALANDKILLAAYDALANTKPEDRFICLHNLAADYYAIGIDKNPKLLKTSEKFFLQALQIYQDDPTSNAARLEEVYESLGLIAQVTAFKEKSSFSKAEQYDLKALQFHRKLGSADQKGLFALLLRLGDVQTANNHLHDAIAAYSEALKISPKVLGPNDQEMLRLYASLAETCRRSGDFANANVYYQKAYALALGRYGQKSRQLADILAGWGHNAFRLDDFVHAKERFEQCLAIRRKLLGENNPDNVYMGRLIDNLNSSLKGGTGQPASPDLTKESVNK
jgi:serine/threonine protein kinase